MVLADANEPSLVPIRPDLALAGENMPRTSAIRPEMVLADANESSVKKFVYLVLGKVIHRNDG
jgi:hypothetical protein